MSTHNFDALRRVVIDASVSKDWGQAVAEWRVVGVEEDARSSGVCVCSKTGLRYLFEIYNYRTHQNIIPIGSSCINLFDVKELDVTASVLRRLFELRAAFTSGERVFLTPEFFSRATLADLWQNGAFPSNGFNRSNGDNDYRFLLDMFNRRRDLTPGENRKVWVLLNRTIKNFVMNDERLG